MSSLPGTSGVGTSETIFDVGDGGVIDAPSLRTWAYVNATIRDTGRIPTAELTALRKSSVTLDGGTAAFPNVNVLDSTSLYAYAGSTISFPGRRV